MVFGLDFLCDFRVAKGSPKTTNSGQNKGNMVKTSANNSLNVSGLRCLCFDMEGVEIPALGTQKSMRFHAFFMKFFHIIPKIIKMGIIFLLF